MNAHVRCASSAWYNWFLLRAQMHASECVELAGLSHMATGVPSQSYELLIWQRTIPQALEASGVGLEEKDLEGLDKAKCGILIGTAMGGMQTFSTAVEDLTLKVHTPSILLGPCMEGFFPASTYWSEHVGMVRHASNKQLVLHIF